MSMNFRGFQSYLAGKASKHVDLLHGIEGRHSFSRFESRDELEKLRSNAQVNGLIVGSFFGRARGSDKITLYVSMIFTSYCSGIEPVDIENAQQRSYDIMMDFYAAIIEDSEAECSELAGIRPEEMEFNPIDEQPILENHYGWEMTMPFVTNRPAFNPAKWTT